MTSPLNFSSLGGAAGGAGEKKDAKYHELAKTYTFIPIACETLGSMNTKALSFLADLDRRIALVTGDPREESYIFQRTFITVQRFKSVCFKGSFTTPLDTEGSWFQRIVFLPIFISPLGTQYQFLN